MSFVLVVVEFFQVKLKEGGRAQLSLFLPEKYTGNVETEDYCLNTDIL